MKFKSDNGEYIDLPCKGFKPLWHHCIFYDEVRGCGEKLCEYWRDKDWLCGIMCD